MIKRFSIALIFILLLVSYSYAFLPLITSRANYRPPWYADSNVVFSWDARSGSTAYNSSGTALTGTLTNGDIVTYQGSLALRINAADEYIAFAQTGNQYADGTAAQTICVSAYITADPDFNVGLWSASAAANNEVMTIQWQSNAQGVFGYWDTLSDTATNNYDTCTGSNCTGAWHTVGYSHDTPAETPSGQTVNPDSDATWTDGWDTEDASEVGDMTNPLTQIWIGNNSTGTNISADGTPGATAIVYVRAVALINGYTTVGSPINCEALTGWPVP